MCGIMCYQNTTVTHYSIGVKMITICSILIKARLNCSGHYNQCPMSNVFSKFDCLQYKIY